jgi:hypothetical protein
MEQYTLRRVIRRVPIDAVTPSGQQPRSRFHEDSIAALAQSIQRDGLSVAADGAGRGRRVELIAGERRMRALKSWARATRRRVGGGGLRRRGRDFCRGGKPCSGRTCITWTRPRPASG